jgi:hypothetical protein
MHQSPSMSFLIHESAEEYHAKGSKLGQALQVGAKHLLAYAH